jgi:hypothetical protein
MYYSRAGISNLIVNPHLNDFTDNVHDHYSPIPLHGLREGAGGRSASSMASEKSGGKDMDSDDLDPESRPAGVDENADPPSAARASVGPSELHAPISGDREGKAHRVSQRPFVIRRLG